MPHPDYSKNDFMLDIDDGEIPATEEARDTLKKCGARVKRRGLWLQQNHRPIFNKAYEVKLKARAA